MSYFDYATGLTRTKKFDVYSAVQLENLRQITEREMDLAASVQKVTEEILVQIAKNIASETGERNLCLAGGVALNRVANGIINRE